MKPDCSTDFQALLDIGCSLKLKLWRELAGNPKLSRPPNRYSFPFEALHTRLEQCL
jgi:hypothetical protein